MWWGRETVCDVYLARAGLALCAGAVPPQFIAAADTTQLASQLTLMLTKLPGRVRLRLWLSGGAARAFRMDGVESLRSEDEFERAAHALAAQRTALSEPLRLWVEPARAARADVRVAVACEQSWLEQMEQAVTAAPGKRISLIRPWWSEALARVVTAGASPPAVGIIDTESLTLVVGAAHGIAQLHSVYPVSNDAPGRAAQQRALVRAGLDPATTPLVRLELGGATPTSTKCALAIDEGRPPCAH
ncbi:MAG: DUF1995 family protein [Aquabacterium sp.]|nr:DUF1995 family protein [Aquabacterium sp.]